MESKKEKNNNAVEKLAEEIAELFIRQIRLEQKNKIKNFKKHGTRKYKK